jgi:hypothetical protein
LEASRGGFAKGIRRGSVDDEGGRVQGRDEPAAGDEKVFKGMGSGMDRIRNVGFGEGEREMTEGGERIGWVRRCWRWAPV